MPDLNSKVAIITGGARGMGAADARLFVERGAKVVIGDVLEAEGKEVANDLGESALFTRLDVTSEDDWVVATKLAETTFGKLNVLVNNAGILGFSSVEKLELSEYERVIAVNQTGVFLGIKHAVEPMRRAGGGSIVNMSSVEGLGGMPWLNHYTASKWAVRGMTKSAAIELAKDKIRVNSIHPGAIRTPMVQSANESGGGDNVDLIGNMVPMKRMGEPDEVAEVVAFLASDASSYCTGAEIAVDGGASAGSGFHHGY